MTAMTDAQLRAKIRELMAAGVLPSEPAPIQRPVPPAPTGPKPTCSSETRHWTRRA